MTTAINSVTDAAAPPTWEEAHRRLLAAPRFTRLDHPSEMHRAKQLPDVAVAKS